jgi:uncharacterized protein (TIGR02594 family)
MKKLILILAVMLGSVWFLPQPVEARPNKGYHYSQKKKVVKKHNVRKTKVVRQQKQRTLVAQQQRQRVVVTQQPQVNYVRIEDESAASFFARERQRVIEQTQQGVRQAFVHTERTIQYGGDLVNKATKYVGANASQLGLPPRLWCADFMNMIAGGTDRRAISYANRGRPAYHGCVNCVAVTRRKGGHHVGIVKGYDLNGNPIIISGNHNRRVGVGVYARNRVIAYRYV